MVFGTIISSLQPSDEVIYTSTTEYPVWGAVKSFFDECPNPYTAIHKQIGRLTCPRCYDPLDHAINLVHSPRLKAERKCILADGHFVDVIILTHKDQRQQRRWSIVAGGNGEGFLSAFSKGELTEQLEGNTIFFDYRGLDSRKALVNAAIAVMRYVESEGAQQVIGIGISLGGGILREAYKVHVQEQKENVRYAFIFDRTFSRLKYASIYLTKSVLQQFLNPVIALVTGYVASFFAWTFGWNLGSLSVSDDMDFEVALQDEDDQIIHEAAWLKDRGDPQAIITKGLGHNGSASSYHDELVRRVNTHFQTR